MIERRYPDLLNAQTIAGSVRDELRVLQEHLDAVGLTDLGHKLWSKAQCLDAVVQLIERDLATRAETQPQATGANP